MKILSVCPYSFGSNTYLLISKNDAIVIDPSVSVSAIEKLLCENGATLKGTSRLKIKESDRGQVMAQELRKLGVNVEIGDDYIIVPQSELNTPCESIDCHNDHRIAMSFSVLCSVAGGVLAGAECVSKSYPEFFKDIKELGIQYEII